MAQAHRKVPGNALLSVFALPFLMRQEAPYRLSEPIPEVKAVPNIPPPIAFPQTRGPITNFFGGGANGVDVREGHAISEDTRREILDFLFLRDVPINGAMGLVEFLNVTWPLRNMPSSDIRFSNAEGDIRQHMVKNNDWEMYELFDLKMTS